MYTFKTTERTNDKATEYETKSLLYLMTKIKGHNRIDVFIIDCFNDVSGTNSKSTEVWDVQSKGVSSLTPRKIGESLYTLYENYISEFAFHHYILFMPILKIGYLNDNKQEAFCLSNFLTIKRNDVTEGLKTEIIRRYNIEFPGRKITSLTEEETLKVSEFLKEVIFITDRYQKFEYIKDIVLFKNASFKTDEFFTLIFDEIRVSQSGKKIKNISGKSVSSIKEVLQFDKNIHRKDIEMLVINRIVGYDIFQSFGLPISFIEQVIGLDVEDLKDLTQSCRAQIARTLFNKNNKRAFWLLLEEIITQATEDNKASIDAIFDKIPSDIRKKVFTLNEISLLFLISLIKDGLNI